MTDDSITNSNSDSKLNTIEGQQTKTNKKLVLFNEKQLISIVRSFVDSWLRGTVKLHFPTAVELEKIDPPKIEPFTLRRIGSSKIAKEQELAGKEQFMKLVITVCDETATEVEQEEAIASLFGLLMSFRCGERIDGTFTDNDDFSDRLKNVEKQISAMNTLLNEFIIAFKSHKH